MVGNPPFPFLIFSPTQLAVKLSVECVVQPATEPRPPLFLFFVPIIRFSRVLAIVATPSILVTSLLAQEHDAGSA